MPPTQPQKHGHDRISCENGSPSSDCSPRQLPKCIGGDNEINTVLNPTRPLGDRWFRSNFNHVTHLHTFSRASDPAPLYRSWVYIMFSRPIKTRSENSNKSKVVDDVLCLVQRLPLFYHFVCYVFTNQLLCLLPAIAGHCRPSLPLPK